MTTHIVSYWEFSGACIRFGIVGLPTEVAGNIVGYLRNSTSQVYVSPEGELIYARLVRFPGKRRLYSFQQSSPDTQDISTNQAYNTLKVSLESRLAVYGQGS